MDRELANAVEAVRAKYFSADGTACDYAGLAQSCERRAIAACLAALEDFDPRVLRIPAQTAFWLNAYNACVLRDVAELIAASGVRYAEGFFSRPRARIGGHPWSLDHVEHGLLRGNVPKYGRVIAPLKKSDSRLAFVPRSYDERMHFAMFSACRSSPPLRAFRADELDVQLETSARDYVARTARVELDGAVVVLPKIFQWYASDFGGPAGALAFVLARIDDERSIELVDRRRGLVRAKYADFDWTLNVLKPSEKHQSAQART